MIDAKFLPISVKPVSKAFIVDRAAELSKERNLKRPDLKGALNEVMETLVDDIGENLDDERNLIVYQPSGEDDPFLFVVPVKEVPVESLATAIPKLHESPGTIREEFENFIFETEHGIYPNDLNKDEHGIYINKRIRLLWYGFNMYHQKLVQARSQKNREGVLKPLGKYVVCRVTEGGGTLFSEKPVRYQTKALALEEANRLTRENGGAWGIFRCLDVVPGQVSDVDEKEPQEE